MGPRERVLILNAGGLRSLVSLAVASADGRVDPVLLTLHDQRPAAGRRVRLAHEQAKHFHATQPIELPLPLSPRASTPHREVLTPPPPSPLFHPRLLLTALAVARSLEIDRLIWPAQVNHAFEPLARIAEQIELSLQLAASEGRAPQVQTPLLDLSDTQVIELGNQVQAPWKLAWCCLLEEPVSCGGCRGCRRRADAFAAAGIPDPGAA
jgi:7-cyano-7-deazaguanine synthase in queuosine biosynthesis